MKIKEKEENKKVSCVENMTPFILMIGLGAHAIFEGIAVGLSKDMA
jgi:zinc transporter ZupT